MILNLDDEQHEALSKLVSDSVADLSYEIAATDNWEYREMLRGRRDRLTEISVQLESADSPLPS
ncbi:MAG: hypothetical protein M3083_13725 [Actinomycetota bacterium]|nr:hypothetical protein [Actinomycetota bacterium]